MIQGVHVSRIDVIYSDEPELNKLKLTCEKIWADKCTKEKDSYVKDGTREKEIELCVKDENYFRRQLEKVPAEDESSNMKIR